MFPNIKGLKQIFSVEPTVEKFEVLEGKDDNEKPGLEFLGAMIWHLDKMEVDRGARIFLLSPQLGPKAMCTYVV